MKIKTVNYEHGGMALEIVAETDVEYMILHEIFTHGKMDRGNGHTRTPDGHATGFYLNLTKAAAKDGGGDA